MKIRKEIKKLTLNKNEKKENPKIFHIVFICVIIVSLILNLFVIQLAHVNGSSMYPTLKDGQLLFVSKITSSDNYQRGDIIVFKYNGRNLIKRLIGLPGEKVQIIDNDIYINDKKINDFVDVQMKNFDENILNDGILLSKDEFIFLGDNRNDSFDCRRIGAVNKKDIVGKVVFRFVPFQKF